MQGERRRWRRRRSRARQQQEGTRVEGDGCSFWLSRDVQHPSMDAHQPETPAWTQAPLCSLAGPPQHLPVNTHAPHAHLVWGGVQPLAPSHFSHRVPQSPPWLEVKVTPHPLAPTPHPGSSPPFQGRVALPGSNASNPPMATQPKQLLGAPSWHPLRIPSIGLWLGLCSCWPAFAHRHGSGSSSIS